MNNEQWGNIELPGLNDSELLGKDWNRVARSKEQWSDPKYVARVEAARIAFMNDPDYQAYLVRRGQAQSEAVTDEFRNLMANLSIEKWQDPEFRAKSIQSREQYWADPDNHAKASIIMQEVAKRPEVKAALQAGAKRRAKDPKDLALRKEVGARKKGDPAFAKACKDSVTPERIEKFKAATLKDKKPVVTPMGVFRCVTDAAKAHDVNNGCLRARIKKSDPINFRYISIEEYIMLTGKE
jgi:hypothetical protein